MHYKNGREVKVGDQVVGRNYRGNPVAGVVIGVMNVTPGTCNMALAPIPLDHTDGHDTSNFLHVEDALPVAAPETAETAA